MKKLLVLALGILLVLCFTVPAMAETKVEFKGSYRVRYMQLYNLGRGGWNGGPGKDGGNSNFGAANYQARKNSYFDHRFRIEPKFIVSDCLELRMRIDALYNNQWGQAMSRGCPNANGVPTGGDYIAWDSIGGNVESELVVDRLYAMIKTSLGLFIVGRLEVGVAGLNVLGYTGNRWTRASAMGSIQPFDFSTSGHRIMWNKTWGSFSLTAGYQKDAEKDSGNVGAQANPATTYGYDDDQDAFFMLPQFEWKNGSANLLVNYWRSRQSNQVGALANPVNAGGNAFNLASNRTGWFDSNRDGVNDAWSSGGSMFGAMAVDWDAWLLNPAIVMNFGPFAIHSEFAYAWGKLRPDEFLYNGVNYPNVDMSGWGIWLDGAYNYGPGEAGLMFSYLGGRNFDDNANGDKIEGILGLSGNQTGGHTYFLVAHDRGLFNNNLLMNTGPFSNSYPSDYSNWNNHWSLAAYNDYNVTEDLLLHAALGYFQLVNVPDQLVLANGAVVNGNDIKKDLGVELDIGVAYKIMDGLSFSSALGYFWTGSAWKYGTANGEVGNAYAWKNQLMLTF